MPKLESTRPDYHTARDLCLFIALIMYFESGAIAEEGWVSLFDGKTLTGWEAKAKGDVKVVDGEIQILTKANLWLVNDRSFTDFELEAEAFMPESGYNSGIGFRCSGKGKPFGYQCEIDAQKSGAIYAIGKGWKHPAKKDGWKAFFEAAGDCFKNNEWNAFRIRCEGERIQIWVNGHQTADIKDKTFSSGAVALQHHGKGGIHRFRNVRIRKL